MAQRLGWLVYHTHDSRGSAAGFPDLVLVRERVVYVELKSETGKVRGEQEQWAKALERAGAEHHLWRPEHWLAGVVDTVLAHKGAWPRTDRGEALPAASRGGGSMTGPEA